MLIESYSERTARAHQKRAVVLQFLLTETWTGFAVAMQLLALPESATLRTLVAMERDGHVRRHHVPELRIFLWGITTQGAMMAAYGEPSVTRRRAWQVFEPSKVKPLGIAHKLSLQAARLKARDAGWLDWTVGQDLPGHRDIQPDAVVVAHDGRKIAVEVERTVKTKKRYESIFAAYLRLVKEGQIDLVHYVCPMSELAPRLARMFADIRAVPVLNDRVTLNDRHRARFQVFPLATWPQSGGLDILDRSQSDRLVGETGSRA